MSNLPSVKSQYILATIGYYSLSGMLTSSFICFYLLVWHCSTNIQLCGSFPLGISNPVRMHCTYYLDDFSFLFLQGMDTAFPSAEFDSHIAKLGLSKAVEKNSASCVVIHVGFEFDSENMQVRLPPSKRRPSVNTLLTGGSKKGCFGF